MEILPIGTAAKAYACFTIIRWGEPEIDSGIIVFGKITSDLSVFSELDDNIEVHVEIYAE